jgi:3-oxoadipate enol-lactonase
MTLFDQGTGPRSSSSPGSRGAGSGFCRRCGRSVRCRTISYSLCGDFGSGARYDQALGFENYVRQLDAVFEQTALERAALCGISYGGVIAVRYAAVRPERIRAIALASRRRPGGSRHEQQRRYLARPWLSAPSFILTSPGRLVPEIVAAFDTWPAASGSPSSTRPGRCGTR